RRLCMMPHGAWRRSRSCWPCCSRRATAATCVSNEQVPAEHAGHPPALARSRARRPPRTSREGRDARPRARAADAPCRARRIIRALDFSTHPLGVRWADAARTQRAGRRHGADYILGRKGDGASWLRCPPQAARRPQEGLCLPDPERPRLAEEAGAACRGGKPDRHPPRPFARRRPCTQIVAFDYRKPGARRTNRRHADAVHTRIGTAEWNTAEALTAANLREVGF